MNIKEFITNEVVGNDWLLNPEWKEAFDEHNCEFGPQPRIRINFNVRDSIVTNVHLKINERLSLNETNSSIKDILKRKLMYEHI